MAKVYRQVVSDKSITSSKAFNDFLYSWLVLNSEEENGERYIWKRAFVYSKLESELGMTRKTIKNYFENLHELGLIEEAGDKWILSDLGREGFKIEKQVLERLVNMKKRYAVSLYVYLVRGYYIAGQTQLIILLDNVKEYLGLGTNTRSNNYIITDLFEDFRVMGLLNCVLNFDPQTTKHYYLLTGIGRSNYF